MGARGDLSFSRSPLADTLTFKGGTSLSKVYKVIDRFSEDIDLTYDIRELVPDLHYPPGWLREGIADYGREVLGLNNAAAGWVMDTYSYLRHFTEGYGLMSRFLIWLDTAHPLSQTWADVLHAYLIDGTYGPASWSSRAGVSLEQLWSDYAVASGGMPTPLPPTEGVTLYEDINYSSSYPVVLGVGSYTFSDLRERGVPNSWNYQPGETASGGLTSLRVPAGYRVLLFKSTDLTGPSVEVTADNPFLSENDVYRSVIVEMI